MAIFKSRILFTFTFLCVISIGILTACDTQEETSSSTEERTTNAGEISDEPESGLPIKNIERVGVHFYKGVHPLCFYKLAADGGSNEIELDNCTLNTNIADVTYDEDSNWNQVSFIDGDPENPPALSAYRFVGSGADGDVVETLWNGGGSGTFTEVLAVTVKNGTLFINKRYGGGDRCNGGISDVGFTPDDTLYIKQNMTPYDMLTFGRNDYQQLVEPYDDLKDCASCCYGVLETRGEDPYAVYLAENLQSEIERSGEAISDDTTQACFDRHMHGHAQGIKRSWTLTDWQIIQDRIYKNCFQ